MKIKMETKPSLRKSILFMISSLILLAAGYHYLPEAAVTLKEGANSRRIPIYCVERKDNKVALTFDSAWGNENTRDLLEILERNEVRATFFMTGGWVEKYPEDVKAIAAAGHDLGNHSENHKQMSQLSREECKKEIMEPHEKVKELTGRDMILFRPPYGDYNNMLLETAEECGYYTIQWDVDSLDWKDYGAEAIVNEIVENKHLGNGSIILCHNGAKYTKEALETVIKELKKKGFQLVPVSEMIYMENYKIDHEGRQLEKER